MKITFTMDGSVDDRYHLGTGDNEHCLTLFRAIPGKDVIRFETENDSGWIKLTKNGTLRIERT